MNRQTRVTRAYAKRLTLSLAAYVVLLTAALITLSLIGTDSPWRWAVMLLPVPGLALTVWAIARQVLDSDELQSRITVQAMAVAFAAGSAITFTYGLLQLVGAPTLSWTLVWPVYAVCWLVSQFLVGRRY